MVTANGITGSGFVSSLTEAQNRASISRDQFLQILVTELTTQDPLDPLDNAQFLEQLVGLQTLEQTAALTDSLRSFERFLQMSSASGMIGKNVKGIAEDGSAVQGVVGKVVMEKNNVQLVIGNKKLPVNAITEIVAGQP